MNEQDRVWQSRSTQESFPGKVSPRGVPLVGAISWFSDSEIAAPTRSGNGN